MSFYSRIMNDFSSVDNGDASSKYVEKEKLILYIGQKHSKRLVSFKGFIENFKFAAEFKVEEQKAALIPTVDVFTQEVNLEYQVVLKVPSSSALEGKVNLGKFQEFNRMLKPFKETISSISL